MEAVCSSPAVSELRSHTAGGTSEREIKFGDSKAGGCLLSASLLNFWPPTLVMNFWEVLSTACSLADCTSSYKNSADTKRIFGNQIRAPPRRKKKGFFLLFSFFLLFVFEEADVLQI